MLKKLLNKADHRSAKAYKNIIALFVLKGTNIAIGLVLVPLTLHYLDTTRYGIWITLSAIFGWFSLFDIGLGHGLRNRLAEALAMNNIRKARVYVSTTYASLILIFFVVFLIFMGLNRFIDWTKILNTDDSFRHELSLLAAFVFFFFCMRFITQLITSIALAKQEPAFSQMLDVSGRVVSLAAIYLLTIFTEGNLLYLGITLTATPVFVITILSIIVFNGRYSDLKPSIKLVEFKELRYILSLGVKFFIIQITAIIFYQTNNIIIAQVFGPEEVTPYSVIYQYLSVILVGFTIVLTPYWSAFTDAYTKLDFAWIKKEVKKLKSLWLLVLVVMFIAIAFSDVVVRLWVGDKVVVNFWLTVTIGIYMLLTAFNNINVSFLNGTGKVRIQLYIALVFSILHIPLAIYFCKLFGIAGIMLSAIINTAFTTIIYEIQYRKLIEQKAKGIWNA